LLIPISLRWDVPDPHPHTHAGTKRSTASTTFGTRRQTLNVPCSFACDRIPSVRPVLLGFFFSPTRAVGIHTGAWG
jgi:hypothetical protein